MQPKTNATKLLQAAEQFATPLYVYDLPTIENQYKKITAAFRQQDVRFFYACKALTNPHILKFIHGLGCGIDCSSINEVKLALHAGCGSDHVLYTSNGIDFTEIVEAVELGVHVNIDSLSNLKKFGEKFGGNYPVGVRLRPNIMAGGNIKISTGHSSSKFGIALEQLQEILDVVSTYHININGLHIHTGSEIADVDVFIKGFSVLFDLAKHFPGLKFIDLGGGFKVPFAPADKGTDMELLGQKMFETFEQHKADLPEGIQLWFEPGKYLVSEAGCLLARVNVLKLTPGVLFAGIDTGFNHLIRPMFYNSYHHILNISNPDGVAKTYTVTGNICETDTFATDRTLPEVREGDILCFLNAGAYGFEMSSYFNSRYRPAEVMYDGNSFKLIRRRDKFDDLLTHIAPLDQTLES